MRQITPSTGISVGAIAIFYYPDSGLKHVAFVEIVLEDSFLISETNYKKGEFGMRLVKFDDYALLGFTEL